MDKRIYAVFDKQVGVYLNPLVFVNDAEAVRWFTHVVNKKGEDTNISLYPEHFSLWYLGILADDTGQLDGCPEVVTHGNTVKEKIKRYTLDELMDEWEKRYQDGA